MNFENLFESIYTEANHLRELTAEKGLPGSEITGEPDKDFAKAYIFYVDDVLQKGYYVGKEAKKKYVELKKQFPDRRVTYVFRKPSELIGQ